MKKLYKKKLGKVHPSPPPPPNHISDHLSLLPAKILALTTALSIEDKQVLAYLISCTNSASVNFSVNHCKATHNNSNGNEVGDHGPMFFCSCFCCYKSYWVKWDASPNRQLIHEIIEGYEEGLVKKKKRGTKVKKEMEKKVDSEPGSGSGSVSGFGEENDIIVEGDSYDICMENVVSVRRFVDFIGERIWGVWNRN